MFSAQVSFVLRVLGAFVMHSLIADKKKKKKIAFEERSLLVNGVQCLPQLASQSNYKHQNETSKPKAVSLILITKVSTKVTQSLDIVSATLERSLLFL